MKLILACIVSCIVFYSQNISSVNSGAISSNKLIYSVSENFVIPQTNSNEVNSGIIGAVSRIEFFTTGVNNVLLSDNIKVYPNPTSKSLFFETNKITIYGNSETLSS